jgi:L-threonylcarbamoyladenylate synthase
VCDLARAGLDTLAVRSPAHPLAQALIARFEGALAAPSANRSGRPSPTCLKDALEETGSAAAAALDGGPCAVGLESTVVSLLPGDPARMLRPGGVSREALIGVLGSLASGEGEADAARSPGRLARHYAPAAPLRLNVRVPGPGEAYLAFGPAPDGAQVFTLSPSGDLREAAANLFACLRAADRLSPSAIAVAPIPAGGLGEAINDRLVRAAGYVG